MLLEQVLHSNSYQSGQAAFAEMAKRLLHYRAPALLAFLPEGDSRPLLDPVVFASLCLDSSPLPVEQALLGYMEIESRPSSLRVRSDREGVIYLPNIGYLNTERPDADFLLQIPENGSQFRVNSTTGEINYHFEPLTLIPGTRIELSRRVPASFYSFHAGKDGAVADDVTGAVVKAHESQVFKAFLTLAKVYPAFIDALNDVVRSVVLFRSDCHNSFSSLAAHGAAFFNVDKSANEVFFIEDILHQCGHVLFSSMTYESDSYFTVAADHFLPHQDQRAETRSVYVVLHALFTEAAMSEGMNECCNAGAFEGQSRHELVGRIAFIMRRFEADIKSLISSELLSQKGLAIVSQFCKVFTKIYEDRKKEISNFDFSNQPYTFSCEKFFCANPGRENSGEQTVAEQNHD